MSEGNKKLNRIAKCISVLLLISMLGIEILLPVSTLAGSAVTGAVWELPPPSFISIKDWIIDLIARIIAAVIIRALTNQIVSWIQGDGGRNVGFVQNVEGELRKQLDLRGAEFLNKLAGVNLCDINLKVQLDLALRTPGLRQSLECTVTQIVGNVQSFYQNFQNGSWPAFFSLALQPQNNPTGAFLIALDAKTAAEAGVVGASGSANLTLQSNRGFLGFRKPVGRKCESLSPATSGTTGGTAQNCHTEYQIKTPGGLAADALTQSFGSGLEFTYVADEIDEAIVAIANALIGRIISTTFSSGSDDDSYQTTNTYGSGVIDDTGAGGSGQLAYCAGPGATLQRQINDALGRIGAIIAIIDAQIAAWQAEKAANEDEITSSEDEIDSINSGCATDPNLCDPARIDELNARIDELSARNAELDGAIADYQAKKAELLQESGNLAQLQAKFNSCTVTDPDELAQLGWKISSAISKINQISTDVGGPSGGTTVNSNPSGITGTSTGGNIGGGGPGGGGSGSGSGGSGQGLGTPGGQGFSGLAAEPSTTGTGPSGGRVAGTSTQLNIPVY